MLDPRTAHWFTLRPFRLTASVSTVLLMDEADIQTVLELTYAVQGGVKTQEDTLSGLLATYFHKRGRQRP